MELSDINAELDRRAVVVSAEREWEPSPSATVWRKPLFRRGGEYGPVTSLVRYEGGGAFRAHAHPEGEEILVLGGVFADEYGDYPAGTHLLNPHGTRHAPASPAGCVLLVRLRQYAGGDRLRQVVNSNAMEWLPDALPGTWIKRLYRQQGYPETITLVRWEPGVELQYHAHVGGEEILVLEGGFEDEYGRYGKGTWVRMPHLSAHRPFTSTGCILYQRVGGLAGADAAFRDTPMPVGQPG